jgi:hypothetical protein
VPAGDDLGDLEGLTLSLAIGHASEGSMGAAGGSSCDARLTSSRPSFSGFDEVRCVGD